MDITMTSSAEMTPKYAMKYYQLKAINAGLSIETYDKFANILTILVNALRTKYAEKIQHDIADFNRSRLHAPTRAFRARFSLRCLHPARSRALKA